MPPTKILDLEGDGAEATPPARRILDANFKVTLDARSPPALRNSF